jgi:hypothetical protein
MKAETHFSLKPVTVALAVLLASCSLALPVVAADKTDTETAIVTRYTGWGDPAMAEVAVNSGQALINHLMTTQALLDAGEVVQARSALIASREFAEAIERMMPYLTVVEEMLDVSDRVVQEKVGALSNDLLPIYAGIDEMIVYAPQVAGKTRGLLKQAENHARNGDTRHAASVLREAASEVSEHTVYLPVGYVERQIRVAQNALNQEKPDVSTAKAAVENSLDSLNVVVDTVIQAAAR